MAHRLATGRTGTVALLYPQHEGKYQELSFAELVSWAEEVFKQHKIFALLVGIPLADEVIPGIPFFIAAQITNARLNTRPKP